MKTRIRARLGMAEKDFAKVKFLLCQGGAKVNALNDGTEKKKKRLLL